MKLEVEEEEEKEDFQKTRVLRIFYFVCFDC